MDLITRIWTFLRPRGKRGWLRFASTTILTCQLLIFFGAFSPIFSPLIYPQLAPQGWHNITPHGNIVLYSYSVSTTSPGLIVACASTFTLAVTDPSTWGIGTFHVWLSRDGGASWKIVWSSWQDSDACDISIQPDGSIVMRRGSDPSALNDAWVSRDDGKTWQRPGPTPTVRTNGVVAAVSQLISRGGILYGTYATNDAIGDIGLAVSSDSGHTWSPVPSAPSALVQAGWKTDGAIVPDYRAAHAWFRTVYTDGNAPVLEHTSDDGRTWIAIAQIGRSITGDALLGVNPSQPGRICADAEYWETNHISLLSSPNGGEIWQVGTMPPAYQNTSGEPSFTPVMDAQGNCYQGYHYGRGGPPGEGSDGSQYVIFRLTPASAQLQPMPVTSSGEEGNLMSTDVTYVPAGNGMSERLVIEPSISYRSMAAAFSSLAGETTDAGQLLWRAVP